jgi:hypothetical protein
MQEQAVEQLELGNDGLQFLQNDPASHPRNEDVEATRQSTNSRASTISHTSQKIVRQASNAQPQQIVRQASNTSPKSVRQASNAKPQQIVRKASNSSQNQPCVRKSTALATPKNQIHSMFLDEEEEDNIIHPLSQNSYIGPRPISEVPEIVGQILRGKSVKEIFRRAAADERDTITDDSEDEEDRIISPIKMRLPNFNPRPESTILRFDDFQFLTI